MMMLPKLFDLLILTVFSVGALASPVGEIAAIEPADLAKRFSGTRWTWYDVETGNEVSCGKKYKNKDAIVAISDKNMQGRKLCGKRIKLTYKSKTRYATIVDTCPGCPYGALDLSRGLFAEFASLDVGVLAGNWDFA